MRHDFDPTAALDALGRCRRLLVCPHDDPDPDALAAAWGLARLLEARLGAEVVLGFEGIIGRAENRALLRELGIKLRRSESLDPADFDGVFVVDGQPGTGNVTLPPGLPVLGCVDHHPRRSESAGIPWYDVRPAGGTSTTLVLGYYEALGMEPDSLLATAMLYALKTDTRDLSRQASPADLAAHTRVFPLADHRLLGAIVNPRLEPRYFELLDAALRAARLHEPVLLVYLDELAYPDLVAELADLLVRRRGVDWCLCAGIYRGTLRLSLRSELDDARCGAIARRLVEPEGGAAGGHGMTAGGRVVLGGSEDDVVARGEALWARLAERCLAALDAPRAGHALLGASARLPRLTPLV